MPTYNQDYVAGTAHAAALARQSLQPSRGSSTGTAGFYYAFPIHYKDPTVQQWNLTVEQNIGHSIGLRLSYTGSHGQNLEAMEDLNQVQPNTVGYTRCCRHVARIPNWSVIQSVANAAFSNY